MGTTFRYIAENALRPSGLGDCQHCERTGIISFPYNGEIQDPKLAANSSLAAEEPEIFAACADCIKGGNLRKGEYEQSRLESIARSFSSDPDKALLAYHGIPHVPLMMQDEDWPICCDDWCEFLGTHQDY